jgi:predicted HicB family RNase H-like nuclease
MPQNEDISIDVSSPQSKSTSPDIEYIASSRERMAEIQENLTTIIGAMEHPSYFTRVAEYWGAQPQWKKIGGGVVLSLSILAIGLIAHIGLLISLSAFLALTYFGGSLILDDHYASHQRSKDNLHGGIAALTDLLGTMMETLEKVCHQLNQEIEVFQNENVQFRAENAHLKCEVEGLQDTRESLNAILEQSQKQLIEVEKSYQAALLKAKTEMGLEIEALQAVRQTLASTISTMSLVVVQDESQRTEFLTRLHTFIEDGNRSFAGIADRISQDANELAAVRGALSAVKDALNQSNTRYLELLTESRQQLDEHKELIERLRLMVDRREALGQSSPLPRSRSANSFFIALEEDLKPKSVRSVKIQANDEDQSLDQEHMFIVL